MKARIKVTMEQREALDASMITAIHRQRFNPQEWGTVCWGTFDQTQQSCQHRVTFPVPIPHHIKKKIKEYVQNG
jgi:hypothetical protein